MGEFAAKFRPEVDLDEFERRLRAATPAPQQRAEASDPLAELARLVNGEAMVNREDPFAALFRAQSAIADVRNAAQSRPADPAAQQRQLAPNGLREPYFEHPQEEAPALRQSYAAQEGAQTYPHQAYPSEAYAAEPLPYQEAEPAWAGEPGAVAGAGGVEQQAWPAAFDEPPAAEPAPRVRRKVMVGMAAILALGVAAAGATLALRGKSDGKEVVTIQADSDPAKIKPAQAESASTPEGQALFDRKGANGANNVSKVVGSAEQPADLGATVKNARAAGAASVATPTPPSPSTVQGAPESIFPAPRKVKTVSVRADGTVINGAEARAQVSSTLPTMAAGAPAPDVVPTPPTRTPVAKSTERATSTNEAAPKAPSHAKIAKQETPKEVAAERGNFAVQLAGTPSEAEARAAANSLSAKFSSALQGHHATYVEAKVGAKSIWRVRVGHLSRESADSICAAVKAQGGRCFVAKN
ncbi:MAG TPA: SPOR domain-containing protein [Rhodoblastus sp.]|nr:SPOR domain-containing protein [Rhodoblastus sp.]